MDVASFMDVAHGVTIMDFGLHERTNPRVASKSLSGKWPFPRNLVLDRKL